MMFIKIQCYTIKQFYIYFFMNYLNIIIIIYNHTYFKFLKFYILYQTNIFIIFEE
jgi:hypothetical protein